MNRDVQHGRSQRTSAGDEDAQRERQQRTSAGDEDAQRERWQRASAGDKEAWNEILRIYDRKIYTHVLKETRNIEAATDITSEVFISVFKKCDFFTTHKNPEALLFLFVKWQLGNYYRKRKPDQQIPENYDAEELRDTYNPTDRFEQKALVENLQFAMDELPSHYREVILLTEVKQMSGEEAAQRLGVDTSTLRVQKRRAIVQVREIYRLREAITAQSRTKIEQILNTATDLNPKLCDVFRRREFDCQSLDHIAKATDEKVETIRTRLKSARETVCRHLTDPPSPPITPSRSVVCHA